MDMFYKPQNIPIKDNNMNKYRDHELGYKEMTKGIGGQSIPSECFYEPMRNHYENTRKGYNDNGLDQSAMEHKRG
jgi:hypothetical protein